MSYDPVAKLINFFPGSSPAFHRLDGKERHPLKDSSLISFLNYLFSAFPDLHYSIDNAIAEGDIVVLNLSGKATHKGEFPGYPASNKQIAFTEMFFLKFYMERLWKLGELLM